MNSFINSLVSICTKNVFYLFLALSLNFMLNKLENEDLPFLNSIIFIYFKYIDIIKIILTYAVLFIYLMFFLFFEDSNLYFKLILEYCIISCVTDYLNNSRILANYPVFKCLLIKILRL
jgi:hypothetical protein